VSTDQHPTLPITVHGHPNADTLLLWAPPTADDGWVTALAKRVAGRGHRVVVPTWADGRDLLRSVRYARESAVHPPDQLTIVGYDAAGVAALSLALHQRRLRIGLREAVCVAAGPDVDDPISRSPLPAAPPAPAPEVATTVTLVPDDDADRVAWAEATSAAWGASGWPVTVTPLSSSPWAS
jgi:hypothetical protein